jgi:hypothetical protein
MVFMQRQLWLGVVLTVFLLGACSSNAVLPSGEKLLVWSQGSDSGQLLLVDGGTVTEILALASAKPSVVPCGTAPTSPNGNASAFSVADVNTTTLYLMRGTDAQLLTLQGNINPMTCVGDNLQYAPDSNRVGYLAWAAPNTADITPSARLFIHNVGDNSIQANIENVASFDMTQNGADYITFFANQNNKTVQVGINRWDGSTSREVTTIYADESNTCDYQSANIRNMSNQRMAVILAYRCARGETRTQYQLYIVDVESNSSTLLSSGVARGALFAFTRTTNIYPAPNGNAIFATIPDGVKNDSSKMLNILTENSAETVLIERNIVMPQVNQTSPNAVPSVSYDGRWLAMVENDGNNIAKLSIFDLDNATFPPIVLTAGSAGDAISSVLFSLDSKKLFYVAGTDGENNSAFALDLATGVSNRLIRGKYNSVSAIAPSGSFVALTDRRSIRDDQPTYDVIVMLDLANGTQKDVLVGADVTDSTVTNVRELVPIAWRK